MKTVGGNSEPHVLKGKARRTGNNEGKKERPLASRCQKCHWGKKKHVEGDEGRAEGKSGTKLLPIERFRKKIGDRENRREKGKGERAQLAEEAKR